MRKGFSMLLALVIIIVMAFITLLIFNLTGKMTQETTAQYKKEQSILYARSYTEYAIMLASANECFNTITSDIGNPLVGDGYRVTINITYLGNELAATAGCTTLGNALVTNESRGNIIQIDVYVQYKNPEKISFYANNGDVAPFITYHKKTIQRL